MQCPINNNHSGTGRWFASVPSSTQPNRLFVHSGTSAGATSNIPAMLAKGYPQRTIFENLDDAGISWGIYYQNIPATLFYRNLRKVKYTSRFHPYDSSFKKDAGKGKLPGYVVIEQRYTDLKTAPANDDHPSHDVYRGQMFVKEVLAIFCFTYILDSHSRACRWFYQSSTFFYFYKSTVVEIVRVFSLKHMSSPSPLPSQSQETFL